MYKEKHILNHHAAGHTLSCYLDVYELDTVNCSANKTTGYKGDTVTITGTPALNEKTSNNLLIYCRGQGIITDHNVAGSALTDALHDENIPVETLYWYNYTAMCAPNPIVQHSDITWTE